MLAVIFLTVKAALLLVVVYSFYSWLDPLLGSGSSTVGPCFQTSYSRLLLWVSCYRAFSCNQIEVLNGIVVYQLHSQTAQFMVRTKTKRNSGLVSGPFPRSPRPLYQLEVKCSVFDMEIIFHSHANKTHFHKKGCTVGLILKVRDLGTRKSAISFRSHRLHLHNYSTNQSHIPKNGRESLKLVSWLVLMSRPWIPVSNLSTGKNRITLLNVSFPLERPKTFCAINFPSGRFPEPFCKR